MSPDPLADNILTCPYCQALNTPGAVVCRSCGVNMAAYQAMHERVLSLNQEADTTSAAQLEEKAIESARSAIEHNRRYLIMQIRFSLITAGALAVLLVAGSFIVAELQRQRTQRLAHEYEQAMACLDREDYRCARDTLEALVVDEPTYPEAVEKLRYARYEFAAQLVAAGQWEAAIAELDKILRDQPTDRKSLDLMRTAYDRWYMDALARGDMLTAFRIDLQRKARFPQVTDPNTWHQACQWSDAPLLCMPTRLSWEPQARSVGL